MFHSDKIEIRKSLIHGYGVFAKEDIKEDELLEECHYIEVENSKKVYRYIFNWPRGQDKCEKVVIPFGFGSIYNCVTTLGEENTNWKTDLDNDILVFYTIKDIKKNTELLVNYDY